MNKTFYKDKKKKTMLVSDVYIKSRIVYKIRLKLLDKQKKWLKKKFQLQKNVCLIRRNKPNLIKNLSAVQKLEKYK